MIKSRTLWTATVALLVALSAWPAFAQSHARIVRLSYISGEVQLDRDLGAGYEKAILNSPITEGMKLKTGSGALAEVEFEDGSTVRLTPDSSVQFPLLQLRDNGAKASTVQVDDGTVYFNVVHKGDDEFGVRFANRSVDLKKSAHFRVDVGPNDVQLAVFKGKVPVSGGDNSTLVEVKSNEAVTLPTGGSGNYEVAKKVAPDQYDSWDEERLNYEKTYASESSRFDLPYSYGASDLSYYGTWYSYPGYGYLWRPYGVGYGWDPFYDAGNWAWYPGWGYTYVSYYPWGWMPYRYGTWMFVPNFGWAWQPGGVTTWSAYPRVVNPPRGWVPPRPPTTPPSTVIVNGGTAAPGPRVIQPHRGAGGTAPTVAERTPNIPSSLRTTVPVGPRPAGMAPSPEPAKRWNGHGPRAIAGEGMVREPRAVPMGRSGMEPRMGSAPSAPRMSAPAPRPSAAPAPRMSAPPAPRATTPHVGGGGGGARTPHRR